MGKGSVTPSHTLFNPQTTPQLSAQTHPLIQPSHSHSHTHNTSQDRREDTRPIRLAILMHGQCCWSNVWYRLCILQATSHMAVHRTSFPRLQLTKGSKISCCYVAIQHSPSRSPHKMRRHNHVRTCFRNIRLRWRWSRLQCVSKPQDLCPWRRPASIAPAIQYNQQCSFGAL